MSAASPEPARGPQALRTLAAAFAHAPENAAYGLLAFAPLGAAFGPKAMALAMMSALAANTVAAWLGGGRLVGGPRASLALLTAALVTGLATLWPAGGPQDTARIVALVAAGVAAAGLLQCLFGALRLGGVVKYTPYPVQLGLASGIGLLLAWTAWPVINGLGFGAPAPGWPGAAQAGALATGIAAAGGTAWATWRRTRVPPLWLGLLAGVVVHAAWPLLPANLPPAPPVGTVLFVPGVAEAVLQAVAADAPAQMPWRQTLNLLAAYALTVAVLCSLDTLLAASLVDGRQRQWRDPNRELMAQGLANLAAATAGAQAASPSVPRSMSLMTDAPPRRHAVRGYVLAMLLALAAAPWLLAWLPSSVLGGVLLAQGLAMVSPVLLRTPWTLLRQRARLATAQASGTARREAPQGQLWAQWSVAAAVALGATTLGVAPAVLIGAALAVLLFVRANLRDVVRAAWRADQRHSLKVRTAPCMEALRRHGRRIAVLELEGVLFFGTADTLRARLHALSGELDAVVLDLRQIREIDVTGARILAECARDWADAGLQLILAEWPAADARRQVLQAIAGVHGQASLVFEDDADQALERAEDSLLARLGLVPDASQPVALHETALAQGLDAAELQLLSAAVQPVRFARGDTLFRRGDPGDALFMCLAGHVGLRVPGDTRRLVSLAAGVSLGEIALLSGGVRTVDAVAETEVHALRLPAAAFAQWKHEQPVLAAKLLNNLALQLSGRLHLLTEDLARWVARAGAAPGTARGG